MGRVTAEQFRAGQHDQFSVGKNKTARERSFDELDAGDRVAHDFAEPLDFALGLKINDDAKLGGAPIAQARGELRALRFHQHEIADREIADVAAVERAPKIFRLFFAEPAFANFNVGFALFLRFDFEPEMIRRYVIADDRSLLFRSLEQNFDALQVADGCLRIDVEFAERLDIVSEIFDTDRARRLPGKQIDDAAADGELAARRDLRGAVVTGGDQRFDRPLERMLFAPPQNENGSIKRGWLRRRLIKCRAGGDN